MPMLIVSLLLYCSLTFLYSIPFPRNFDGAFLVTSTGEVSLTSKNDVEEQVRELLGIGHDEL